MFIPSSNNAISVFFLVVTERQGQRGGGVGAQCNMFILLAVNEARTPPCVARSTAAAKVGKQMFALRFNQILASPSPGATWRKDFNFFSDLYNTLTSQENHTYLRPPYQHTQHRYTGWFLAPTGALIVIVVYYTSAAQRSHFLRFRAFLPIYLVFLFENWMQIDNNWPWGPWWL